MFSFLVFNGRGEIMTININKQMVIDACKHSLSMAEAAKTLNMHFNTFKKYAKEYDCYHPNQSGKKISKKRKVSVPLSEILTGNFPQYQTNKLKKRLISNNILENKCAECHQKDVWNNKLLILELDHIDGNRFNHQLSNLRLLCPNCHSQTTTFRGKNSRK